MLDIYIYILICIYEEYVYILYMISYFFIYILDCNTDMLREKVTAAFFSARESATEEVFRLPTPKPYLWIDVGVLQCIRIIKI